MSNKQLTIKGTSGPSITVSLVKVKTAQKAVRALNHAIRQKILKYISDKGKTAVTPIYEKLGLEQSVCSQHLRILRDTGLVKCERDGKLIYYTINETELQKLNTAVEVL